MTNWWSSHSVYHAHSCSPDVMSDNIPILALYSYHLRQFFNCFINDVHRSIWPKLFHSLEQYNTTSGQCRWLPVRGSPYPLQSYNELRHHCILAHTRSFIHILRIYVHIYGQKKKCIKMKKKTNSKEDLTSQLKLDIMCRSDKTRCCLTRWIIENSEMMIRFDWVFICLITNDETKRANERKRNHGQTK